MFKLVFFFALLGARAQASQPFYEANPTYHDAVDDDATWKHQSPAEAGLDEALLGRAARELGGLPFSFSLVVVRHDALVFERYFHGSSRQDSNNIHSASKSILAALVGIASSQGVLKGPEQPLRELLPAAREGLRLKHLLTMTSGIEWEEDKTELAIEKEPNWVDAILRLPFRGTPGEKWHYSTALTHLLSAALGAGAGESAESFARKNLFVPLGIAPEHWGHDPQGVSSGGYNLYLTPRELAKFGRLYLHGGDWNGTQVVPRAWVEAALSPKIHAHDEYDYGYCWHLTRYYRHDVKIAWGWGGQFLYLVPDLDMVIVMTTNTRDFQPDFEGGSLLERFILPAATP